MDKIEEITKKVENFSDSITKTFPTLDEVMPEQVKQQIEELEEKLRDLESRLSQERKQGYQFFKTPLLMRIAQSKINIARASWEEKDIEKAKQAVMEVLTTHDSELKEGEKIKIMDEPY